MLDRRKCMLDSATESRGIIPQFIPIQALHKEVCLRRDISARRVENARRCACVHVLAMCLTVVFNLQTQEESQY